MKKMNKIWIGVVLLILILVFVFVSFGFKKVYVECLPEQRNVDSCIEISRPVCATFNIQCINAPCDPVIETVGNSCKACNDNLVDGYFKGKC